MTHEAVDQKPDAKAKRVSHSRVSALDRILQIFDRLQTQGEAMSGYDIAHSVGAPLSTMYALVNDLVEREMLVRNERGAVWLGPRLYRYGLAYARSLDFMEAASKTMQDLCAETAETVQICGRDGDAMVVLAMAEGIGHFRVTSRIGTRVPLNWTASGKLLVGHLPRDERTDVFRRSAVPSPTGKAETDPHILARMSEEVFRERLSFQASESEAFVACIASPIIDAAGRCVAAISIVASQGKIDERRERFARLVQEAAKRVEQTMGWSGGSPLQSRLPKG